jgi:copper(I)-binding protein
MVILRTRALRFALFACGLTVTAAAAQPVTVKDAWVRAPAPGQKIAAGYMELVSRGNMVLVAIASPVAAAVELHRTTVENGVMKMRQVGSIELPAGKVVKFAPGGLHVMLVDLKQPLRPGDQVALTLTVQRADFGNRSVFTVQAEVRSAGAEPSRHH